VRHRPKKSKHPMPSLLHAAGYGQCASKPSTAARQGADAGGSNAAVAVVRCSVLFGVDAGAHSCNSCCSACCCSCPDGYTFEAGACSSVRSFASLALSWPK